MAEVQDVRGGNIGESDVGVLGVGAIWNGRGGFGHLFLFAIASRRVPLRIWPIRQVVVVCAVGGHNNNGGLG